MGVEGDKGPGGPFGHLTGQTIRQTLQPFSCLDIGLKRQAGQPDPGVFGGLPLRQPGMFQLLALLPKPAALVRAGNGEGGHAIPYAEGPLIAKQPGGHRQTVQRPGHDLERAQAALGRPVTQRGVHGEELQKIS